MSADWRAKLAGHKPMPLIDKSTKPAHISIEQRDAGHRLLMAKLYLPATFLRDFSFRRLRSLPATSRGAFAVLLPAVGRYSRQAEH